MQVDLEKRIHTARDDIRAREIASELAAAGLNFTCWSDGKFWYFERFPYVSADHAKEPAAV